MSVGSGILTLEQVQAEELAGRAWTLGGTSYRFANHTSPGEPPWESGSEGIAYPLMGKDGKPGAYAKFFDELKITEKRIERTRWLIGQRIDAWGAELRGAPRGWVDTREVGRPDAIGFDFICSLAQAVPGSTWATLRFDVKDGAVRLDARFRRRCAENLLRGLVTLEQRGVVHGDLSRNNVIVNPNAADDEPALYLIDFDAFYAPHAGQLAQLTVQEGGTFGTDGYCPPDLALRAKQNVAAAAPYSDRYARDMLLLELLCFHEEFDEEEPPASWPFDRLRRRLHEQGVAALLPHLGDERVFKLTEDERPSSRDAARGLQMAVPPRMKPKRTVSMPYRSTSEPSRALETLLRTVTLILALLCAAHWGIISFVAGKWVVGSGTGSVAFAVRWITCGGLFLAGLMALSALTFAGRQPKFIRLAGVVLQIPQRRDGTRSELAHVTVLATQLLGGLTVLGAAVWFLVRSGW